jgi:hypothetical protein
MVAGKTRDEDVRVEGLVAGSLGGGGFPGRHYGAILVSVLRRAKGDQVMRLENQAVKRS